MVRKNTCKLHIVHTRLQVGKDYSFVFVVNDMGVTCEISRATVG